MSDNTRDQSLAVLRWLMEAGADEAVSETPVNRFAQVGGQHPPSVRYADTFPLKARRQW